MRLLVLSAMALVVAASSAFASQVQIDAPELNGGTAITALTLLAGGVAVLRARLKR